MSSNRFGFVTASLAALALIALPSFAYADDAAATAPAHADEHARKAAQGRAAAEADQRARANGEERPIDLELRESSPAPAPAFAAPQVETRTEWYGWEIMATDAASVTLLFAGAMLSEGRDSQALGSGAFAVGLGGLALAPAYVHYRHGNYSAAVASIGVRVGLPAAGMALGFASGCNKPEDDVVCPMSMLSGFVVGSATALIVDYAFLSRSKVAVDPRRDARSYGVAVAPRTDGGFTLSLGGSF